MKPLVIRGHVWRVVRVAPDNPFLIDRTGVLRIATTDPSTRTIRISESIPIPMFDQVYLHEVSHAIMYEAGVTELLEQLPDDRQQILAEELLAWFMEHHGIEAIDAASSSLGRRICVSGTCIGE